MTLKKDFSLKKLTIFSLAIFGLCFWASNSMAQSERDKPEMERERPVVKPLTENQSDQVDMQLGDNQDPAAATNTMTNVKTLTPKTVAPKKDIQVSGEGKKVETTSSTLSFNIFLYIVDKFKSD